MSDEIQKSLDKIIEMLDELKQLIAQNKSGSNNTTKITVIGNRPQKTMKVKGIDSDSDFVL